MKRSIFCCFAGLFAIGFCSTSVHAQSRLHDGSINYLLNIGVTNGGDELVVDPDTADMSAGGGQTFSAGAIFPIRQSTISLQVALGFHFDYISFTGNDGFARYPLELMSFYNRGQHRVGGGLSYINSPRYSIGDFVSAVYEDAVGVNVEYNYVFRRHGLVLGARYQFIEYELERTRGRSVVNPGITDGSVFGISLGWAI